MFKLAQLRKLAGLQMPSDAESERIREFQLENLCEYNERADIAWAFPLNQ